MRATPATRQVPLRTPSVALLFEETLGGWRDSTFANMGWGDLKYKLLPQIPFNILLTFVRIVLRRNIPSGLYDSFSQIVLFYSVAFQQRLLKSLLPL